MRTGSVFFGVNIGRNAWHAVDTLAIFAGQTDERIKTDRWLEEGTVLGISIRTPPIFSLTDRQWCKHFYPFHYTVLGGPSHPTQPTPPAPPVPAHTPLSTGHLMLLEQGHYLHAG